MCRKISINNMTQKQSIIYTLVSVLVTIKERQRGREDISFPPIAVIHTMTGPSG